jgi:hypothetical protein
MATHVRYNGVTLHNVMTREFVQETIYDGSNTDQIGVRFSMRFEGVIHLQTVFDDSVPLPWTAVQTQAYSSSTAVWQPNEYTSTAKLFEHVRGKLSAPRGALEVLVDNETLLLCVPALPQVLQNPNRDISNGPHPQTVQLQQIAGRNLFRVSFAISCEKLECQNNNQPLPFILNNRWSVSEALDSNFFTTRTISGTMRLSVGGLAWVGEASGGKKSIQGITPEVFRPVVVPPLEKGFRREQFEFSVSKDGLSADYTVLDRQVHHSAPWPATDMSVQHDEQSNNGITWFSSVDIELRGPPHVSKYLLISRLIDIADNKLSIRTGSHLDIDKNNAYILQDAVISDFIGADNKVRGRFRIQRSATLGKDGKPTTDPTEIILGTIADRLGKPLSLPALTNAGPGEKNNYDPTESVLPQDWGYDPQQSSRSPAVLMLLQCYLQYPCSNCHDNNSLFAALENPHNNTKIGDTTVSAYPYVNSSVIDSSRSSTDITPEAKRAIYTQANIENIYTTSFLRVQVPIARAVSSSEEDTCVVAQVGPGQAQREIIYEATRVGEWPLIPEPLEEIVVGSLVGTLVHQSYAFQPPTNTPDARSKTRHLRARYVYLLNRPPKESEKLNVNSQPFQTDNAKDLGITLQTIYDDSMASGDEVLDFSYIDDAIDNPEIVL